MNFVYVVFREEVWACGFDLSVDFIFVFYEFSFRFFFFERMSFFLDVPLIYDVFGL